MLSARKGDSDRYLSLSAVPRSKYPRTIKGYTRLQRITNSIDVMNSQSEKRFEVVQAAFVADLSA